MAPFPLPAAAARLGPAFALTLFVYALTGLAAMPLASAALSAPLLYPAAGVALAALLVGGQRLWPAIAIGAFVVHAAYGLDRPGAAGAASWLPAAVIAAGAVVQALVGARIVARLLGLPLGLSGPREVAAFFAIGAVSCAIGAAITAAALYAVGHLDAATASRHALAAWVGNTLGIVAATPMVLTLVGQPREAWEPRRSSVGLTLALTLLLLALGILQIQRWSEQRAAATFERDAASAASMMTAEMQEPLLALEALRSVFIASSDVSREEMHVATRAWLRSGRLQNFVWMEPVAADAVAAFEERQRAEGVPGFRVAGYDTRTTGDPNAPKLVIRFAEAPGDASRLLGIDALTRPEPRAAIDAAVRSGRPTVSASFPLASGVADEPFLGIAVYQAVYRGPADNVDERRRHLHGLLAVGLRADVQLAPALAKIAPYLQVCAVDVEPGAAQRRLAGAEGCEAADTTGELHLERPFAFAGRRWEWRIAADPAAVPAPQRGDLLFALAGLVTMALLGGFLLTVTGRAHRIETAVRDRTAALESEVREREVAGAALRESEQRFRSILDNVPIGVVYGHLDGTAIQTNASMCQLTGYSEEELLRLRSDDYTHPDDVPQDTELLGQLVRGEIPRYRRHKRFRSKTGAIVWVQATVTLLRDGNGTPQRVIAVFEDITEHLRLEEAEYAREVAESSNQAKSEFLSRMSHELRTPLNAMLGFAQLLELDQRHPLAETQQPWVRQIQQAGWHLLDMINDVLDLSRIESGNLRLQTEPLDVSELLAASLSLIAADARRRGIVITQELEVGAATVLGDATRVKQVLTNLLSNAVKYNVDAGRIHIGSRRVGTDRVEIAVTDTGLGMTPDQTAQLFQPFNRLGRERTAQEGTGIGLVISQRLAELMGGSLQAHSVSGQGSSFVLCLPRVDDADTVRSELTHPGALPAEYHRRVVHYVEDNETNVEVMRGILAQRPQVQMEVSVTGLDSLAAIRTHRPDLLLLDMHLPDISGLELLRHLKANPDTADIPVVVVSADALAEQIDTAAQAGAAHYLTKPVSVAEVLAVVDGLLEQVETRYG